MLKKQQIAVSVPHCAKQVALFPAEGAEGDSVDNDNPKT